MRAPDWMHGWQIDHVEAHRGDVRQTRFRLAKRSAPCRVRGAGPGEHLVPGTKPRAHWIDDDAENAIVGGGSVAVVLRELRAVEPFARDVLAGVRLGNQSCHPRSIAIDPAFDGVFVFASFRDGE